MHRAYLAAAFLLLLGAAHVISLDRAVNEQHQLPRGEENLTIMPLPLLKISSLEFSGIAADLLFINSIVYIGGEIERDQRLQLSKSAWDGLYNRLKAITELDPYFVDPYYIGNAYLTWYAHRIDDANTLLEKGSRYRTWDWIPPFFIGFNSFYFQHDNIKASNYLMEAWRRPGASPTIGSLASKLAFKGKETENAISLLEEVLKTTEDGNLRKQYKDRLGFLKGVLFLERAVDRYKRTYRSAPSSLHDLVRGGIISDIPVDPSGGTYYLAPDGSIQSSQDIMTFPLNKGQLPF